MLLYSPKLNAFNKAFDGDKTAYERLCGDNSAQHEDRDEAAKQKRDSSDKNSSFGPNLSAK